MEKRRINMVFKENREGNIALAFLQKVRSKSKSVFVSTLISDYLTKYGINTPEDVEKLTQDQIDYITNGCINGIKNNDNSTNELISIIKSLVNGSGEIRASNTSTHSTDSINQSDVSIEKENTGKVIVHDYDEESEYLDNDIDNEDFGLDDNDILGALNAFNNK